MLRRMSLVGDAMAHAILPGAAIGFLISGLNLFAMTFGGLIAGFTVAILAGLVARTTELKEDASLATFYLVSLALGVTIVSMRGTNIDLLHVLFGNILAMDDQTLLVIAFNATVTLIVLAVIYRPLVIECVDPVFLRTVSRAGAPAHLAFLALVVINLVNGFHALGTLLAVGLMVLPAGIARFWSRDITGMMMIAVASAMLSGYLGLVLSFQTKVPSGPAIILVAAVFYVFSVLFGSQRPAAAVPAAISRHDVNFARLRWVSLFCAILVVAAGLPARGQTRLNVVASFSILGDLPGRSAATASPSPRWSAPTAMCTSTRRRLRMRRKFPTPDC
jgi:zinc/manganese transport system permease protein